jgi:hypothetical protein
LCDFDNDGDLDLHISTGPAAGGLGKKQDEMLLSLGGNQFSNIALEVGVIDLFVTNGEDGTDYVEGPQFLYRNAGNANPWLKIKLMWHNE